METRHFTIDKSHAQTRIDKFLSGVLSEHSRTAIQRLIKEGNVLVNGVRIKSRHLLKVSEELVVTIPSVRRVELAHQSIPLDIVYEDADIIIVNKPYGMVVHPAAGNPDSTLVNALLAHTDQLSSINSERPGIVHRLDKETSGIMVVAKNNEAHLSLVHQLSEHTVARRYIALVKGDVTFKEGIIDAPISRHAFSRKKMAVSFESEAKAAQTRYRTIKRFQGFTLLELFPKTGRTHQLRVHLAHIKHPILGDSKYGNKGSFSRLALHAKDLGFLHPRLKKEMHFTSPLPEEMRRVIGSVKI